jgi:hypothetical protein
MMIAENGSLYLLRGDPGRAWRSQPSPARWLWLVVKGMKTLAGGVHMAVAGSTFDMQSAACIHALRHSVRPSPRRPGQAEADL